MRYTSTFSYFFPISLENLPYFRYQQRFCSITLLYYEIFNSKEPNESINVLGEFDLNRRNSLRLRKHCEMLWKKCRFLDKKYTKNNFNRKLFIFFNIYFLFYLFLKKKTFINNNKNQQQIQLKKVPLKFCCFFLNIFYYYCYCMKSKKIKHKTTKND